MITCYIFFNNSVLFYSLNAIGSEGVDQELDVSLARQLKPGNLLIVLHKSALHKSVNELHKMSCHLW